MKPSEICAILVPKLANNTAVAFNLYYPHLEVWECFEDFWEPNPDVTITLAMDTLLNHYYVSNWMCLTNN